MIDIDYHPITHILLAPTRIAAKFHARQMGMEGPRDPRFFIATSYSDMDRLNGVVLRPDVRVFSLGWQSWYPEAQARIRSRQR